MAARGGEWARRISDEVAWCRAGGRRRHNRERQDAALARRVEVARLLAGYGGLGWGVRARIARDLGVHRSTVARDVDAIVAAWVADFGPLDHLLDRAGGLEAFLAGVEPGAGGEGEESGGSSASPSPAAPARHQE